MKPEELFKYADRFATRAEAKGLGTQYPTFRQIAKRFRVNYDQIEDAVSDGQGNEECGSYFGVAFVHALIYQTPSAGQSVGIAAIIAAFWTLANLMESSDEN